MRRHPEEAGSATGSHPTLTMVRNFVDQEVLPVANAAGSEGQLPAALVARMKEMGLFGTIIPKEYGGLGLDVRTHAAVMEELARGWVSVAGVLNPHVLCCNLVLNGGTDAQRRSLLPRLASGAMRGAFSITEPHAGSDAQAITTTATQQPDGSWRLDGHKRWITNGLGADVIFVLAISDPGARPRHAGMTCFLVEKTPFAPHQSGAFLGAEISEIIDKMGDLGVETTDLVLDGYICPPERVLGGEAGLGKGFLNMITAMETGRIGAAAMCVGVAQRCFDVAIAYACARHTFGKPIAEHQAIQFKLADMATKIRAARLLTQSAADVKDSGGRVDLEAGMAKLFASEAAKEVAEDTFRIHGSNGYSKACEAERLFRDALSLISAEGPSEIQRLVIGRSLVRNHTTAD